MIDIKGFLEFMDGYFVVDDEFKIDKLVISPRVDEGSGVNGFSQGVDSKGYIHSLSRHRR